MMTLFDDEYILRTYIADERKDAAEKAAKEAELNTKKEMVLNLVKQEIPIDTICKIANVNADTVKQWLNESMAVQI